MTTEELVVLDQQAKEALNEIQRMSNMYVKQNYCLIYTYTNNRGITLF